ncbi:hypothetical protein WJX79_007514 [Trebouxia sp. C0005]
MSKPFLDKKATDQLNLSVLRRVDPDTEQVLATAGHVALYVFDTERKAWSRKDVEGSLFLLKRQTQPRFKIVILNKKSQDNFVEDVLGDFKFEVAPPYVLYRSKLDEVIGVWFYDQNECAMVAGLLQRITAAYAGQHSSSEPASILVDPAIPQSRTPTPADDAFWDRHNPEATSITAINRNRLLQPAHPPDLTPGPSIDPSQAGPSSDGAAVQSPFGLAGSSQPTEGAASDSSQQAQGDILRKLLSQSGSANGMSFGSPPRAVLPGPQSTNSPTHHKAADPGEEQNPLSALFANIKVSTASTPVAQTPPPNLKPPAGTSAPPGQSPALLTPSFFRQHSTPQEAAQLSASEPAQQDSGNALQQVFARAASKSTPRTDPADATLQSQLFPSAPPSQSVNVRDKIRKALIELANSDAFLDLIVDQLQSKGLQL